MHPLTAADLDTLLNSILDPVGEVIKEIIPMTKPSPYMKRWWTKELTTARKTKNLLQEFIWIFLDLFWHFGVTFGLNSPPKSLINSS